MPYNGSGTFLRVRNWVSDAAASIKIKADLHDSEDDNFMNGLSNALTKDGQTQPTANIPMNGKKLTNLGAPTAAADAVTKAYVDGIKTFNDAISITGLDGKGQIKFTGSQSPAAEPQSRPLGLNFAQADLFFGVKPDGLPAVADLSRWVWNDKADGSGADVMTLSEFGRLTVTTSDNTGLVLVSSIASASSGPNLVTYRRNANAAANDALCLWVNYGRNDANADVAYTTIYNIITKTTTGAHEGYMSLRAAVAGAVVERIRIGVNTTIFGKLLCGDIDATNLKSIGGLTVEKADDSATIGPYVLIDRISASPAAADILGSILFRGRDSTASGSDPALGANDYARIYATIADPANNSESGKLVLGAQKVGTMWSPITIDGSVGKVLISGLSADTPELINPNVVDSFQMTSSDDTASGGPLLYLDRKSPSPAAGDTLGVIYFRGNQSSLVGTVDYGRIIQQIDSPVTGSLSGKMFLQVSVASVAATRLLLDSGGVTAYGNDFIANSGFVGPGSTHMVFYANAGNIYLRAAGRNDTAMQAVYGPTGDFTIGGDTVKTTAVNMIISNAGTNGHVYLRPKGNTVSTNQWVAQNDGSFVGGGLIIASGGISCGPINCNSTITASGGITGNGLISTGDVQTGGSFVATVNPAVVASVSGGAVSLRPNGKSSGNGEFYIDSDGSMNARLAAAGATFAMWVRSNTGVVRGNLVYDTSAATGLAYMRCFNSSGTYDNALTLTGNGNASLRNLTFSGAIADKTVAGQWTAASDARIKSVKGDYLPGLDEIVALQPRIFNYLGNDYHSEPGVEREGIMPQSIHQGMEDIDIVGLIAQEAEVPMPDLVKQKEGWIDGQHVTDLRDLDPTNIQYALINAVKQIKALIDELRADVAALQGTPA